MKVKHLLSALAITYLGAPASAFWRMECRGIAGVGRIDPLMSLGAPSKHVHEIFGSGGFSEIATYEDLMAGNCTSCAALEDKSAYWAPAPYFQDAETGEYEAVPNIGGMLAYYFLNAAPSGNQSIQAFPNGFRMIAGDSTRRNYTAGDGNFEQPDPPKSNWAALGQIKQSDLAQRALGFNCLDYGKAQEGSLYRHFLPSKDYIDANCINGIRTELMFPQCWNGVDLDSEDHKSHVTYPDLVMEGNCPDEFPVRLPGLFYETIWDFYGFKNRTGMFVLSNGDPLGFGYHGDFMMGWDQDVLQRAVDTCTSSEGTVQACPVFTLQNDTLMGQCHIDIPEALAKENVVGPVASLPGDVAVAWGPDPATDANPTTPTVPIVVPTLSYSAGSTASVNGSYLPGQVFYITTTVTATPSSAPNVKGNARVTTSSLDPTDGQFQAVRTQTVSAAGLIVSEIVYEEEVVYVTEETTTTVWVEPTGAARKRHDAHMRRHMQGRHA